MILANSIDMRQFGKYFLQIRLESLDPHLSSFIWRLHESKQKKEKTNKQTSKHTPPHTPTSPTSPTSPHTHTHTNILLSALLRLSIKNYNLLGFLNLHKYRVSHKKSQALNGCNISRTRKNAWKHFCRNCGKHRQTCRSVHKSTRYEGCLVSARPTVATFRVSSCFIFIYLFIYLFFFFC